MAKRRRRRRRKLRVGRVLILLIILAVAVYLVITLVSCAADLFTADDGEPDLTENEAEPTAEPDPIYRNSYNWGNLSLNDGYYTYEDDTYTSRLGIDVSHFQEEIDWQAVHNAGIEFAFIRAGYRGYTTGELHEDTGYRENIEAALDAGVEVAVYFFSQANGAAEGEEEAAYLLKLIEDYPVNVCAYDLEIDRSEGRLVDTTQDASTEAAKAFCTKIAESGYTPLIYGSVSFLCNDIRMSELQDISQFWLAWYDDAQPPFPYAFTIWQYSCTGSVPGISTDVDMNILFTKK